MRWWKSSLLALAVVAALPAQNRGKIDIARVGARIACQCGCSHTVATCDMFECSFSKPAKEKIARLQVQGVSDQAIVDEFVKEFGQGVYRAEPNAFGWIVPYASILGGLALIYWFLRRYYRKPAAAAAAPEIDDAQLAQYRAQIDKDLAHLD